MEQLSVNLLVIGGGAAGMAAALSAAKKGLKVMLCEKEGELGGILRQCLHRGFGRAMFHRELTGPEYAERFISKIKDSSVLIRTGSCILSLSQDRTALLSSRDGLARVHFDHCILATGCRERTIESLGIAGTRPAGVFTAGTAQYLENLCGSRVGRRIVIVGSGDVGQIMARHFVQSGREVVAMLEQNDRLGGLPRNRRECLEAYHIPVHLRTTIDEILGNGRIRGVRIRHLDSGLCRELVCDALVSAVGLIPDRALCRKLLEPGRASKWSNADDTSSVPHGLDSSLPPWLSLCGNCESVHDIVDSVTKEAEAIGEAVGDLLSDRS